MTIGEKIRQARQELGLSQRQLCGEKITRNMLSQIENGSARPSMDTLAYFAGQLGKPISYFLDEEAMSSPNQAVMDTARGYFVAGQFAAALDELADYCSPDPVFDGEKSILAANCRLFLAQKAFEEGRIPYAHQLLEQAGNASPYFTAPLERERLLLLGVLPPTDDRELLLRAENALLRSNPQRALEYLTAAEDRESPRWNLLCGKAYFAQKAYEQAIPRYEKAVTAYPKEAASALEACHRELGDFQKAYFYACKLREL